MKKRFILAITAVFLILNCFVVFAEETEDYQYEVRDGKAVLTSYLGTDPILEIPLEIEGYTVIGLEGTFKENRFVQEITISDGIEFLGEKTFYRCRNLEVVNLPDSIIEMGGNCFSESAIKEIYIPSGLKELPLGAFSSCEELEKVDFSNSNVEIISQAVFFNCSSLVEVNIPNTVTEIGDGAFGLCNSLEVFIVPENIKTIVYNVWPVVYGNNLKLIINLSNKEFDRALFDNKERDYAWFTTEDGYELAEYLPVNSTIYRRKKDSAQKYVDEYLRIIENLQISMEDANTKEEVKEYILSKKPTPQFSTINCEIEISSFYAAKEGDEYRTEGSVGYATLRIKAVNSAIEYDEGYSYTSINIIPIPYKEEEKPSEEESTDGGEEETTDNNQETTDDGGEEETTDNNQETTDDGGEEGTTDNNQETTDNGGEEETTDNNQETTDNEEESTENKPDETTDSSQEEETSSNNDKNVIKVYFEQVLQSIPDEISMKEVNAEEEASAYVKGFFDETLIDKYKLDISIESFRDAERGTMQYPSGRKGSFRIFVRSEGMGDYGYKFITITPTSYVENGKDFLAEEYANRYKKVLEEVYESGISMTIVNTPEEAKQYIESLAPNNKNENVTYEVKIFVDEGSILFRQAIAGTRNNKLGKNGSCPVGVIIKNSLCTEDVKEVREIIPILATKYEGNSNSSSSSDRDDEDEDEDDEPYTSVVDTSYKNKNTLSNLESLLVSNTATVFFGNVSQVKTVEKTENGICIISKNNEVIFNKKDGTLAKNEWQKSGDDWYYFDSDCKAAKGWKFLGNQWYYLNDTTKKMENGWLKSPVSGKWYYLDLKNGNMKTGWQQVSSKWYYMDSTGAMMANTITPDGYRVNGNGEWIQ